MLGHLTAACSRKAIWQGAVGSGREDLVPFADEYLPEGTPEGCLDWLGRFLALERSFIPIESRTPLGALRQYLSTHYPWARLVVEGSPEPSLRWEIRPFCAPMSILDAVALMALTVGSLLYLEQRGVPASSLVNCGEARRNFDAVVLDGISTPVLAWRGGYLPARRVLEEICSWAHEGLISNGCTKDEVEMFLRPVLRVCGGAPNGAEWVRRSVRKLRRERSSATWGAVATALVRHIAAEQGLGARPVAHWPLASWAGAA